jgi:fermentation-respiration switch protein FrsA (DUF1100 family)
MEYENKKTALKLYLCYVVPGASHVDLYNRPEYMKKSLPKQDSFFKEYLK